MTMEDIRIKNINIIQQEDKIKSEEDIARDRLYVDRFKNKLQRIQQSPPPARANKYLLNTNSNLNGRSSQQTVF